MTEFLKLLAVYYMCDHAAALRPLSPEEVMGRQRTYEAVKVYFTGLDVPSDPTLAQIAARNQAAYAGFKSWEAENAGLVAEMKAEAAKAVSG